MLQEQHQQATASGDHKQHQQRQQEQDGTSSAEEQQHQQLGPGTTGPADDEGLQQQQRRQQVTWLNKVVPGDRSVTDTILGLWGSLGPWRRLHFIWDLLQALGEDVSIGCLPLLLCQGSNSQCSLHVLALQRSDEWALDCVAAGCPGSFAFLPMPPAQHLLDKC